MCDEHALHAKLTAGVIPCGDGRRDDAHVFMLARVDGEKCRERFPDVSVVIGGVGGVGRRRGDGDRGFS